MDNWTRLDLNVQESVLLRVYALADEDDVKCCRLVSRQWRQASLQGVISLRPRQLRPQQLLTVFPKLKRLDLTRANDLAYSGLGLLGNFKYLTELKVPLMTDDWLIQLCQLTRLQRLNLSAAFLITDEGLLGICRNLNGLTYLNLKNNVRLGDGGIKFLTGLGRLAYLNLSGLPLLTPGGFRYVDALTSLKTMKMNNCPWLDDEGLEIVGRLRGMTKLHMTTQRSRDSMVTDVGLMGLSWTCSDLKELALSCCPRLSSKGFLELTGLQKLQTLKLEDAGYLEEAIFSILGCMLHLQDLTIDGCIYLTSDTLARLTSLKLLGSLSLSSGIAESVPLLMDKAVDWLSQLSNLKELRIRGYSCIDGQSIHKLTSLTSLSLVGCPDLSDHRLTGLSNLSLLKRLEHIYCDGLTDDAFISVACLRNLESFSVSCNRKVTGKKFSVLTSLTALTSLTVHSCEAVGDEGFAQLSTLRNLRSIDFSGCKQITDVGVEALASSHMPELQYVRVTDCNVRTSTAEIFRAHSSKFRKLESRRSSPTIPSMLI